MKILFLGPEPYANIACIDAQFILGRRVEIVCSGESSLLDPRELSAQDYLIFICTDKSCPTLDSNATKLFWYLPNDSDPEVRPFKAKYAKEF